jgi:hypothetical protein
MTVSSALAVAADVRKVSRPFRVLARLRPTPAKRLDRLERLRLTPSAHALAADTRKVSRPSRVLARLRPTPARRQHHLERSCACGRHPQSVSTACLLPQSSRLSSRRPPNVHVVRPCARSRACGTTCVLTISSARAFAANAPSRALATINARKVSTPFGVRRAQ